MRKLVRLAVCVVLVIGASANSFVVQSAGKEDIITHLNEGTGGKVNVAVPAKLKELLKPENGNPENGAYRKAAHGNVGYRIQVYSGSGISAKNEAQWRQNNVESRFPHLKGYIGYKAPSWRLRIGDFRTRGEAVEAMKQMEKAFPSYAEELTIVVDKINTGYNE